MTGHALDPELRRVLGVLIEKAKTTPGGYPMTVSAIVTGCNQKSNRDPQTSLDEADVMNALHLLVKKGAVEELEWLGRVPKYRHLAYDWLSVNRVELAVIGELLLRGAQTLGELRGRAARMEPIADVGELEPIVHGLVDRGLIVELTPAGRGQVVTHNLFPPDELDAVLREHGDGSAPSRNPPPPSRPREHAPPVSGAGAAEAPSDIGELRSEIAALRRVVADLQTRVDQLEEGARGSEN